MGGGELAGPKGREGGRKGGEERSNGDCDQQRLKKEEGEGGGRHSQKREREEEEVGTSTTQIFFSVQQPPTNEPRWTVGSLRRGADEQELLAPPLWKYAALEEGGEGAPRTGSGVERQIGGCGGRGSPASSGGGDSAAVGQHGRPAGPEKRGLLLCRQRGDGKSGKGKKELPNGRGVGEREKVG